VDWTELSDWPEYTKLFAGLFALTPPSIVIPVFLGLTGQRPESERRTIALVGVVGFAAVMIAFVFLGEAILDTFSISIAGFRVAGGLMLLVIGFNLLRAGNVEGDEDGGSTDGSALSVALVPLAIPILAGPGAISAGVIYAQQEDGITHRIVVALVIVAVAVVVYLMFRASLTARRFLTPAVMTAFNRIMGLIVVAIAVEFIFHGFAGHFPDVRILH